MEKAKAAASDFLSKSGHHDSTVHERVAPSVTSEHVMPTRHENVTTAVDKEVHQDHHHTTVLPVEHQEVLPEKHHHNLAGVQHKTFDHGDHDRTKSTLETERAQYKDTSTTHDTKHTQAAAPQLEGEHVHHHVHETVQPVVHKETIAPSVVHTTVPIHETHHNEARHHDTTTLPTMTMDEFTKHGGSLHGKEEHRAQYDGCPDPSNPAGFMGGKGLHIDGKHGDSTNAGPHSSNMANKADPRVDNDLDGRGTRGHTTGTTGVSGNGYTDGTDSSHLANKGVDRHGHPEGTRSNIDGIHTTGVNTNKPLPATSTDLRGASVGGGHEGTDGVIGTGQHTHAHEGYSNTDDRYNSPATTGTGGAAYKKPSLMDKLNPMKDSNGDGKKGFMK